MKKKESAKPSSVFFDTNFLIYLAKPLAPEHPSALKYFRWLKENKVPMMTSAVCIAEFTVKGSAEVIPREIEVLALEVHHAEMAGNFASRYYAKTKKDRACIADDLKIIAQANIENAAHFLSSDKDIAKICKHLQDDGVILNFSITDPIQVPAPAAFGYLDLDG